MKRTTKLIVLLTALLLTSIPNTSVTLSVEQTQSTHELSAVVSTPDVPYVWQEINGFCHWAALSMLLQYIDIDLDLYSLFSISGIGFSSLYVREEGTMAFFPGTYLRETATTLSTVSEFYGLNSSFYIDTTTDMGSYYAYKVWSQGLDFTHLEGRTAMFDLMRDTIDLGYPLMIGVDPYYLPAEDYDVLRAYGMTGGATGSGHAIVVTGYDDLLDIAYVLDPGVGAFGDNYGYPDDGRYSYTISYTALNLAWQSLGYWSLRLMPGDGPPDDFDNRLGKYIYDRISGNRTSYFKGLEDYYFLSVGEKAFRGMSLDMTTNGLIRYIEEFNTTQSRMYALMGLGLSTEAYMTLQYLSYRTALDSLPRLLPGSDLNEFVDKGRDALPHIAVLSNNESLTNIFSMPTHDSILLDTFLGITQSYNESDDLRSSIEEYSEDISTISEHLLAIADSWKAAGNALVAEFGL
ncbi:MAG: C39 family peptidase, partial [Candidatus Thorarchaeota archaeon]